MKVKVLITCIVVTVLAVCCDTPTENLHFPRENIKACFDPDTVFAKKNCGCLKCHSWEEIRMDEKPKGEW